MIIDDRERFDREYGCTEREWHRWMPAATGGHACADDTATTLRVPIGPGWLQLSWRALPPRVIALVRLPRLAVHFEFVGVPPAARREFLRRFDLHLQRGGG